MHNRRVHKEVTDEKPNLDRYLITYSDLITLLLGLFVILYAASQVDEGKYKQFADAFTQYFKPASVQGASPNRGLYNNPKQSIPEPIFPHENLKSIDEIKKETEKSLGKYIEKGLLSVTSTENGIIVTLPEKLLFQSGSADIQTEGRTVLDSLTGILAGINKMITIDGHTDSKPIKTFRFESNWHLSVARALNVGYNMISKGLPEENVIIRGFGAQQPVAENSSNDGRAKNRRVDITITDPNMKREQALPAEQPAKNSQIKNIKSFQKKLNLGKQIDYNLTLNKK